MHFRWIPRVFLALLAVLIIAPAPADAQLRRLRRTAENAAERELSRAADRIVGDAVACAVGNRECAEEAKRNGEDVVFVDENGDVVTDENGTPISDPDQAQAATEEPGQGRWANYDYLRGDRPIYNSRWNVEDTENPPAMIPNRNVRVGRIPSNVEFVSGNMQIVQLDGANLAEFTTPTIFRVPLAEPLPEDFSLEFTVQTGAPNMFVYVHFEPFREESTNRRNSENHYLNIWRGSGIYQSGGRISGVDQLRQLPEELTPIKFQVDDGYAVLYVGSERIAQVPNFQHPVGSNVIEFEVTSRQNNPAYIRDIRIDYGVEDPYETFMADGEYTTRSIFFDFNSAELKPESTPELERIRRMLDMNPSLESVTIEGHTDSVGEDDYNLELSQDRADAVRDYLVENGIDGDRIDTEGKGETEPVASNDTDDGRAQNRRVRITTG